MLVMNNTTKYNKPYKTNKHVLVQPQLCPNFRRPGGYGNGCPFLHPTCVDSKSTPFKPRHENKSKLNEFFRDVDLKQQFKKMPTHRPKAHLSTTNRYALLNETKKVSRQHAFLPGNVKAPLRSGKWMNKFNPNSTKQLRVQESVCEAEPEAAFIDDEWDIHNQWVVDDGW